MHELLNARQMGRADALAIAGGTPGMTLMEAAGQAVAEAALQLATGDRFLVIAGPGNNGGDGFVAARLLQAQGKTVTMALFGDPARLRGDAAVAMDRWAGETVPATLPLPEAVVIIDALFGAGLDRDVTGEAAALVEAINHCSARVLAVDLPSGLDSTSGHPLGIAVQADATCTFFRKKPGHLLYPGRALCGDLHLAQIGIPDRVLGEIEPQLSENLPTLWQHAYPIPSAEGHKYQRGHAMVVSGPPSRTGAVRLAAGAALRTGAGLVTLASPTAALPENAAHLTAIMLRASDNETDLAEFLSDPRFSAVALGPGLGTGPSERRLIETTLAANLAVVLDADALTAFADNPAQLFELIQNRDAPVILTPHEGEFARLFPGLTNRSIAKPERALAASQRSGAIVVLKGPDTVIAGPDGCAAINTNAPPWLATAGSGDVLTGIATGLTAQRMPAFDATCAAVWLHGRAGQIAGPGLTADDLDQALRQAVRQFIESARQGTIP